VWEGTDDQVSSLEKKLKELEAKSSKGETEEQPSTLMGTGLGGRLMIGGPG
jgi:clathrin heavy chain